jgi:hypothetical protein
VCKYAASRNVNLRTRSSDPSFTFISTTLFSNTSNQHVSWARAVEELGPWLICVQSVFDAQGACFHVVFFLTVYPPPPSKIRDIFFSEILDAVHMAKIVRLKQSSLLSPANESAPHCRTTTDYCRCLGIPISCVIFSKFVYTARHVFATASQREVKKFLDEKCARFMVLD